MTAFVADRRQQLRVDGLEALGVIVQANQMHLGTGQVGRLVRFVAGCDNRSEYPFELDQRRGLDTKRAPACPKKSAYDVLAEKEIHHHIPCGGDTVNRWFEEYGIRPIDTSLKDLWAQDRRIDMNVKRVTFGHASGCRSVNLVLDVEELGGGELVRIDVNVSAEDSVTIRSHIDTVHRGAREGKGPIDRKDGEQRPKWL